MNGTHHAVDDCQGDVKEDIAYSGLDDDMER